jgi:hypothetical protein
MWAEERFSSHHPTMTGVFRPSGAVIYLKAHGKDMVEFLIKHQAPQERYMVSARFVEETVQVNGFPRSVFCLVILSHDVATGCQ